MKKKLISIAFSIMLVFSLSTSAFADTLHEAENATIVGAGTVNSSDDASGGQYVSDYNDPENDSVEFNVNVESAGTYDVELSYATPMDDATVKLFVNGAETELPLNNTPDWGNFETTMFNVTLQKGDNTIKIVRGSGYVQLDYIHVSLDGTIYEAEGATIVGAGTVNSSDDASGGQYVSDYNDPENDSVEFNVNAVTAGTYEIELSYATPMDNSTLTLFVNGSETQLPVPKTADWGNFEREIFTVDLNAGDNTIKFVRGTGYVQLDYIEVALKQATSDEGSTDDGSTDDGTTDEGSTDDGSTDDGTTDEGSTDDGSTDDGTTDEGSTDDGSTDDGTTDEGTTDDDSTDDGTTDDGSTDDSVYEAEDATLNGAAKVEGSNDASGGKYVSGYDNPATDSVEFNIETPAGGTYQIELSYSTIMDNASVNLFVNGTQKEISTPPTEAWGTFDTKTFTIDLDEGTNTLKFVKGSGYVQLDYVKVTPSTDDSNDEETPDEDQTGGDGEETKDDSIYEAEDATLNGAASVSNGENASGGKYVSGYDNPATDSVEFNVNASSAGTYQMNLSYATLMDDATVKLFINGTEKEIPTPSTSDWGMFETVTVNIDLQAGENKIKFVKGSGYVQLDYIQVTPTDDNSDTVTEIVNDVDDLAKNASTKVYSYQLTLDTIKLTKELLASLESGYSVELSFGGVKVKIPVDILKTGSDVTLNFGDVSKTITAKNSDALSNLYDFNLSATSNFANNPITLTFTVDPSKVDNWDDLKVFYIDENGNKQTEIAPISYNEQTGEVVAKVTHFSIYGVFEVTEKQPTQGNNGGNGSNSGDSSTSNEVTYEAEEARLVGNASVTTSEGASGGKYVSGFDNPDTDSVEFDVNVSKAGEYKIEVSYATLMDNATLVVFVNGNKKEIATPSTGDWGVFDKTSFYVDLEEGDNTLKVVRGEGYVQLDYIKVSSSNGEVNPQTGDTGIMPYVFVAILALGGLVLLTVSRNRILG
ncbi:CBM35 domain-containing protein [Radiobacillus sp. PE A8.2]|uniref:CBM35 domain-containing protein n=1 Tax=Radiobacillus sp. PE A8.2 TaxID=3380349 RepID=UPI00388EEF4E